jgi:adenine-specific DNA-methyltransferase
MKKLSAGDPETRSADLVAQNLEQLRALFPEAFVEGKVDFEVLKQLLGGVVDEREEKYGLNWHGKRQARQLALTPSTGTLRPCPEESVDWDTTQNLIIEGDNLEVLKLLQKSYAGKVKLIYIDPPYNTGKDFVYPDDFRDGIGNYLEITGQAEGGRKITSNTEASGRFHTDWLNMIWPRIKLARHMLAPDGVIFVSIDSGELWNLSHVCDEVFGEENRVGLICWRNVTDNNPTLITNDNEFILCYARSLEAQPKQWTSRFSASKDLLQSEYERLRAQGLSIEQVRDGVRQFIADNEEVLGFLGRYKHVDEQGVYTGSESVHNPRPGGYDFEVLHPTTKKPMRKPANGYRFPEKTFREMEAAGVILYGDDEKRIVKIKKYLAEYEDSLRSVLALDGRLGAYDLKRLFPEADGPVFTNPKPTELLESLLSFVTEGDDLVVDFFAGSGTTADAVLRLNAKDGGQRRFLLSQLPEPIEGEAFPTIAEITKERVRRVISQLKEADKGQLVLGAQAAPPPQDRGFRVFKLDSSNIRPWDASQGDLPANLLDSIEHVRPDRTENDILYEVLLKLGLDLCVPIEVKKIARKKVHSIGGGVLLACLAEKIARDDAEPLAQGIAAWHKELKPAGDSTCLFRDSAFADDVAKTNLAAILNQHGLTTVRSL